MPPLKVMGSRWRFNQSCSIPDESVVGFEALARWNQIDDLGAPLAVLERAAATGRGPQLDRLCIHTAIESALTAGLAPDTMLFVNSEAITAHVSRADDEVLARGAERLQLAFELTERSLLTDPPALLRKVAALHADGFAVAFDDVGANLDSLALLDVICPDVIKLDLAVVQSLPALSAGPDLGGGAGPSRAGRCDHTRRGHRDRRTPRPCPGVRRNLWGRG